MAAQSSPLVPAVIGGALMGLANLVPGISGGTMLLITGVYPGFIGAIAEVTTLRWRWPSVLLLGTIGGAAGLAILLLAGPTKTLVIAHRWIMYSLFIGLTLGSVPLLWRLSLPVSRRFFIGAGGTFGLMVLLACGTPLQTGPGDESLGLLFLAGLAGASAMVLPGVSGGYLLLLLGQYMPILRSIEKLRLGLFGAGEQAGLDWPLVHEALGVVIPVGLGVVAGIVGVSNLIRWLLEHHRTATLGALMGLVLGAIIGLWPFQAGVPPQLGERLHGQVVTPETLARLDAEDWPVRPFPPSAGQIGAGLGLVALGAGITLGLDRLKNHAAPAR